MAATKINWIKAFQYYCSDPTISYEKVAEKFDVSLTVVKEHGLEDNWVQLRNEALQKAIQKIADKAAEDLAVTNETHANIGRIMQRKALEAVDKNVTPVYARDVADWLDKGVAMERKAYGLDKNDTHVTNVNIQNNMMTMQDFAKEMQRRREQRESAQQAQPVNE